MPTDDAPEPSRADECAASRMGRKPKLTPTRSRKRSAGAPMRDIALSYRDIALSYNVSHSTISRLEA